jgi:hypothetical protein
MAWWSWSIRGQLAMAGGRHVPRPAGVLPRFDRAVAGRADSAWTVSKVIFTGSPVTFVPVGVCE